MDLVLSNTEKGYCLDWYNDISQSTRRSKIAKALSFFIDIDAFAVQQKTFPAPKQGAFNQALGKRSDKIVDATAGWGGDALLMCAQGYTVSMIERHPLMAILLQDAMQRLSKTDWAQKHAISIPRLIEADSKEWLESNGGDVDCIYLDPMFPPKRKKSAAANKKMQFLHWLLGAQHDANDLLQVALNSKCPRIAVKRPDYAAVLLAQSIQASDCFSSKLLHYDVYLNRQ